MVKPTVGRIVWFYKYIPAVGHKGPLSGIVACVHNDTLVNLMVINEDGVSRPETSVFFKQEEVAKPSYDYCEWPARL